VRKKGDLNEICVSVISNGQLWSIRAGLKGRQLPGPGEKGAPLESSKPRASALDTNVQEYHALITLPSREMLRQSPVWTT